MKKIVMAFGAFDGVHTGHIYYLNMAKKLGDDLIVAIARDRARWSFPRHFNLPENERKKLVESLNVADSVILGSTTDALERVKKINPDFIALTAYHPVTKDVLQAELKDAGLKTNVVLLKLYKHELYDSLYLTDKSKTF